MILSQIFSDHVPVLVKLNIPPNTSARIVFIVVALLAKCFKVIFMEPYGNVRVVVIRQVDLMVYEVCRSYLASCAYAALFN